MAKFYGKVGYVESVNKGAGVWEEAVTERNYAGDVIRNKKLLESGDKVHDDISVNNVISIVMDPYAYKHFFAIKYVKWMGTSWKVTNIDVQPPRLLLTIGGVYNGPAN